MTHTDPIADMLTRIRNATLAKHAQVIVPHSGIKVNIAQILKKEGYIEDFQVKGRENNQKDIVITLKYRIIGRREKVSVIEGLERFSKPGRRIYSGVEDIPVVIGGLGVCVVSTSRGLMTGRECREKNTGGEVLLKVW